MKNNQSRLVYSIAISLMILSLPADAFAQGAFMQGFKQVTFSDVIPVLGVFAVAIVGGLMWFWRANPLLIIASCAGIFIMSNAENIYNMIRS